jgi:hypothetical protein
LNHDFDGSITGLPTNLGPRGRRATGVYMFHDGTSPRRLIQPNV